jgi:uncharacterized protein YoxC
MTPLVQAVLTICAVVLTAALVVTLASVRRAASRAEIVLQLVEREVRPLASQLEALAADVRALTQTTNREVERVSGVVRRVEDISLKIARVVGVANSLASFRGITGVGSGLRAACRVFVARLRT